MQGGTHDGYEEAVVEVVQKLGADQGMRDLHHSVAELQRVHEEHERRHAHPVLPPQRVPVVASDLDLPRQRRVQSAEARGQNLRETHGGFRIECWSWWTQNLHTNKRVHPERWTHESCMKCDRKVVFFPTLSLKYIFKKNTKYTKQTQVSSTAMLDIRS